MKKSMILILTLVMVLGSFTTALAEPVDVFEGQLSELLDRGILRGDDGGNLNLDKGLTRAEGVTVYSRLFGLEEDIKKFAEENKEYETGFNDVPGWAADTINYLYSIKVIKGISLTQFGSNNLMTDAQFTTMVLRGLGFNDSEGDFEWDKSLDKAVEIGMIDANTKEIIEKDELFTREEMVKISYHMIYPVSTIKVEEPEIEKENYIELTDAEVKEFKSSKESLFSDDKEHQKEMYDKIYDLLQNHINKYTLILNGETIDLELGEITNLGNLYGEINVVVDWVTWLELKVENNRLTLEGDLSTVVFKGMSKLIYTEDERYIQCDEKYTSGYFPSDPNEFEITIYAQGSPILEARAVNFNPETLTFEIEVK